MKYINKPSNERLLEHCELDSVRPVFTSFYPPAVVTVAAGGLSGNRFYTDLLNTRYMLTDCRERGKSKLIEGVTL